MEDDHEYGEPNQIIALITVAVLNVVFVEHINMAFDTWYALIALVNVLFSIPIRRGFKNCLFYRGRTTAHISLYPSYKLTTTGTG